MNKQLHRHGITRLWLLQLVIVILVAIVSAVLSYYNAAQSVLLGGLVGIIPNAFFARHLFKYQGAQSARKIVNSFYKGEAFKLLLSAGLFTLVFKLCRITPLAFFGTYILILMTHWFAPWIIVNKQHRPKE